MDGQRIPTRSLVAQNFRSMGLATLIFLTSRSSGLLFSAARRREDKNTKIMATGLQQHCKVCVSRRARTTGPVWNIKHGLRAKKRRPNGKPAAAGISSLQLRTFSSGLCPSDNAASFQTPACSTHAAASPAWSRDAPQGKMDQDPRIIVVFSRWAPHLVRRAAATEGSGEHSCLIEVLKQARPERRHAAL